MGQQCCGRVARKHLVLNNTLGGDDDDAPPSYTPDDSDDDDDDDDDDDIDDFIDGIITDENLSFAKKFDRLLRARGTVRDDVERMLQTYKLRNGNPDYRAIYLVLIAKQ